MRLLADENVHRDVIHGLRQANHQVLSVQDIGLSGHNDREILEYSEEQDLILIFRMLSYQATRISAIVPLSDCFFCAFS